MRSALRRIEGAGFEVLNEVVLNQVLVSFGDAEKRRVSSRVCRPTELLGRSDSLAGKSAMRISVSSWVTTEEDVELSLKAMIEAAHS